VPKARLCELALLYLRLGTTAFGGPAAHIAMMEDEVVRRRGWLNRQQFLDYLGLVNLIPGPSSTELAIQIGYSMCGWPGLVLGGVCFILPAALLTLTLAWLYVHYGAVPKVAGILYGIKPVIIAVVLQAIWRLSRSAAKDAATVVIGIVALIVAALGTNVLIVLFGAGLLTAVLRLAISQPMEVVKGAPSTWLARISVRKMSVVAMGAMTGASVTLSSLFLFFLKIGAVLFGSGYVLLAFLRYDLVVRLHWLSDSQLLDAISVGQITPGPVFTTATFIGYVLGGFPGAAVATFGIFLPSFFFIAIVRGLASYLRGSRLFSGFLDGVNVGALALMAVVTFQLGRAALVDWITWILALFSFALMFRFRLNSAWLILAGGLVGLAITK